MSQTLGLSITSFKLSGKGAEPEMVQMLRDLRKKVAIGFVGGSDIEKIKEQLNVHGMDGECNFVRVYFIFFVSWNYCQSSRILILDLLRTG